MGKEHSGPGWEDLAAHQGIHHAPALVLGAHPLSDTIGPRKLLWESDGTLLLTKLVRGGLVG